MTLLITGIHSFVEFNVGTLFSNKLSLLLNKLIFYPLVAAILFIAMLFYFKIADKFNIIDKPNERSSHDYNPVRGGGIIFWLAGVIYFVVNLI